MSLMFERRGNLAIVQSAHYQINFDLSTGTWHYHDRDGYGVIRNAYTKIILNNGTFLTTVDAKYRKFTTRQPSDDVLGRYQQITFSHESRSRKLKINLHLKCYFDQPYLVFSVGVQNLSPKQIRLSQIDLINTSPLTQASETSGGLYLSGKPESYQLFLDTHPLYKNEISSLYKGVEVNQNHDSFPCYHGEFYHPQSKKSLSFGFLTSQKWWSSVQVGYKGQTTPDENGNLGIDDWSIYHNCENAICPSNNLGSNHSGYRGRRKNSRATEVCSESIYLNFNQDPASSFENYAHLISKLSTLGHSSESKTSSAKIPLGSSWNLQSETSHQGFQKTSIVKKDIERKIDFISSQKQAGYLDDVEYVQLASLPSLFANDDMSFDKEPKNNKDVKLTANDQLLAMLKNTVPELHEKGLKASLRFSPFCLLASDKSTNKADDLLLTDERQRKTTLFLPGSGLEVGLLDLSQPTAGEKIRQQIQSLVDDCRIDCLYIDVLPYVQGPLKSPENFTWNNKSLTSIELYKKGLELLVSTVRNCNHEVKLIGEHSPFVLSSGFFSGHQFVSQETIGDQLWISRRDIKQTMFNFAKYLPLNQSIGNTELGAITIDEPNPTNGVHLTATLAAIAGGSIMINDELDQMKPDRLEILDKLFPLSLGPAKAINLNDKTNMVSNYPQVWNLPVDKTSFDKKTHGKKLATDETWNILGIFNWQEYTDQITFGLADIGLDKSKNYLVHDFWNCQFLGTVQNRLTLMDVPPQSGRLLCIRLKQDIPQLLATDLHFSQGGADVLSVGWDEDRHTFLLVCRAPREKGDIFLHLPDDYLPTETACVGAKYTYKWQKPIHKITFSQAQQDVIQLSIRFSKTSSG